MFVADEALEVVCKFAKPMRTRARLSPVVRTNNPICSFWSAKTQSGIEGRTGEPTGDRLHRIWIRAAKRYRCQRVPTGPRRAATVDRDAQLPGAVHQVIGDA